MSSSIFGTGISGNRVSGMMSGLDTEDLVKKMLQGTQSKITKQIQSRMKLSYRQDAYRDIMSKMISFSDKYLSMTSKDNIFSEDFFSKAEFTSSNQYVSVSGDVDKVKDFSIKNVVSIASAAKLSGTGLSGTVGGTVDTTKIQDLVGEEISFELNGSVKKITLTAKDLNGVSTVEGLKSAFYMKLRDAFGGEGTKPRVTAKVNGGKLQFETNTDTDIFGISNISDKAAAVLGVNSGTYNRVDLNTTLGTESKITINGKEFVFAADKTIHDVMSEINASAEANVKMEYSSVSGAFTLTSKETGSQSKVEVSGDLATKLFGAQNIARGTDAIIIDGKDRKIIRASNYMSIDGVNITLSAGAVGATDVTFTGENNVDKVVENVKKFVDEYNTMITTMYNQYKTRPERDYAPLTDEQRKDMTETEQKLWDEKAKAGMLFADQNLGSAIDELKAAIFDRIGSSGLNVADIGIGIPTMDYSGRIEFDENKFREAYGKDPNGVKDLFSQRSNDGESNIGIAGRFKDVVTKYVGIAGEKGVFSREAGYKKTLSENDNVITNRMKEYQDYIDELKTKMEKERKRYWDQFTALETALAKMNNQMTMFMTQ